MNRGWRFCRFDGVVNRVVSCWSLVCPAPPFCLLLGPYWTTFGLRLPVIAVDVKFFRREVSLTQHWRRRKLGHAADWTGLRHERRNEDDRRGRRAARAAGSRRVGSLSEPLQKRDQVVLLLAGHGLLRTGSVAVLLFPRLNEDWRFGKQLVAVELDNLFQGRRVGGRRATPHIWREGHSAVAESPRRSGPAPPASWASRHEERTARTRRAGSIRRGRILTVHLSAVRKALGEQRRPPSYIETVARCDSRFIAVDLQSASSPASRRALEQFVLIDAGVDLELDAHLADFGRCLRWIARDARVLRTSPRFDLIPAHS